MPLGFGRLNERTQRPNTNINFIKPWAKYPADEQNKAQMFLERIAAQCYPVMKKHHLYVQSLEEFPPNNEFLGRNFNAGECIQLVLKDKAGRWLGFKFVQMVMMHELAHCKQMNHSKLFWQERNAFARDMEDLWAKGYLGEGLWGRGKDLQSGDFVGRQMPNEPQIPEHLCGGAYRRAGRKRKRGTDKPTLNYAERQQKRITKKFGKHGDGTALGDDEQVRGVLERGNRRPGKPTVAQSKRGRELRANAALARLSALAQSQRKPTTQTDKPIKSGNPAKQLLDSTHGTDADKEPEWDESDGEFTSDMDDKKAVRIKDEEGRDLIQICGDENEEDDGGQNEKDDMRALQVGGLTQRRTSTHLSQSEIKQEPSTDGYSDSPIPLDDDDTAETDVPTDVETDLPSEDDLDTPSTSSKTKSTSSITSFHTRPSSAKSMFSVKPKDRKLDDTVAASHRPPITAESTKSTSAAISTASAGSTTGRIFTCPVCSLENNPSAVTCIACSNVLTFALMKDKWKCKSEACNGTLYINSGDVGRCGLCGEAKPKKAAPSHDFTAGMTSGNIMRWD